jgi:hypothetical protein
MDWRNEALELLLFQAQSAEFKLPSQQEREKERNTESQKKI